METGCLGQLRDESSFSPLSPTSAAAVAYSGDWLRQGAILENLRVAGYQCHGIDIDPDALSECRETHPNLSVGLGSGESLPFEGNRFDIVLSFDVFEHIRDSDRHIAEVSSIDSHPRNGRALRLYFADVSGDQSPLAVSLRPNVRCLIR
jgi:SAM-dependent methyltransferase